MNSTPQTAAELDELISEPSDAVIESLRNIPGRFAVLGAGGKMGYHLSLMLKKAFDRLGRSETITTVSRFGSADSRSRFEAAGFDVVAADLSDADDVGRLPQFENVFFLAGIKFGTSDQPELLHRMNVQMPQLVASHCRDARVVALSTGCVYSFATPESGGSTEDSPTDPPGAYAQSCKGREAAFADASAQYGTRCSLIRLNYSIDLRYGVLLDVASKVLAGQPVNVEMGYANVIWQGDAIAHTIQAMAHAASPPFVLNVTGVDVLRIRDLATAFASRFDRDVKIEGQEQPTAWLSNASRSHEMFGPPTVPVEQMMDWVAAWLKRGGEVLGKPTHFEVRDGDY